MSRILLEKCRDLVAGERGSALALTLAFLLPVYLLLVGIYGVSETIYRKIQLQNAADAAAYSAATVQADYLSRIAVLNKTVAWSYADMVKRQLDWGMSWFYLQTLAFLEKDTATALGKNMEGGCVEHVPGVHWNAGNSADPFGFKTSLIKDAWDITLWAGGSVGIPQQFEAFNELGWLKRMNAYLGAMEAIAEIKGQGTAVNAIKITKHALRLAKCKEQLDKYIGGLFSDKSEMQDAMKKAANDILDLNLREVGGDEVLRYIRIASPSKYLSSLFNTEDGERQLLEHAFTFDKDEDYDQKNFFQEGIGFWYKRTSSILPFVMRGYHQRGKNDKKDYGKYLHAEWSYFYAQWGHCIEIWPDPPVYFHLIPLLGGSTGYKNRVYDANQSPYVDFKNGLPLCTGLVPAYVYTLNSPVSGMGLVEGTLFGKEGTVVVGLARKNSSPLKLFGTTGLLSAFDAKVCGKSRPDYIWAISAARAAYNSKTADARKPKDVQEKLKSPSYSISFSSASKRSELWNLREADWDVMFVPVRRADSRTYSGLFILGNDDILKDIMTDKENWKKKEGDEWKSADVDWSEIAAPGGDDFKDGDNKLDWGKLAQYLNH